MDALKEIEALVAFRGRVAGSDAERRAAVHLVERLRSLGRGAESRPVSVLPNWPVAHALHAVAAVVGSVLSVSSPPAGVAILLAVAISAFGDLTGSFHLLRRITGRRASQNVVSGEDGGAPGALVLLANYDAGRTGVMFGRRAVERRAALGKLLRRTIGAFEPYFWSILVVLACCLVRLFGVDATVLTAIQFVPTVVLIVYVPLFADVALSGVVPGANDNASGVATVLRLTERYGGRLEHFDLWVVLTGSGESLMLGMREWLREHRGDLDPAATIFLNVDAVGRGTPRFARREGVVIAAAYHPTLVSLCEELAGDGELGARGFTSRDASDGHMARTRGFPAISISCRAALDYVPDALQATDTPDRIDPDALERGFAFCCELIEAIDARVGPDLG